MHGMQFFFCDNQSHLALRWKNTTLSYKINNFDFYMAMVLSSGFTSQNSGVRYRGIIPHLALAARYVNYTDLTRRFADSGTDII